MGQDVDVLFSELKSFPVAVRPIGRPPILCYIPVYEPAGFPSEFAVKGVQNQVRANLANELMEKGLITKQVYDQIAG